MLLVGIAFDNGMSQTPLPSISVSPAEQDFGKVMMGQSSPSQPFTIANTGGADLVAGSIELTGGDSRIFNLDPGTCGSLNPIIPAGATCKINVVFSPASGGGKATALKIVSNAFNSPAIGVPLTGTGLQPLNVGLALALDKTTYDFGEAINVVLTLQNAGGDLYTSKGFKAKPFELFLIFTDPDEKIITSNLLKDTDLQDPPPPIVLVLPTGELVPNLEPVEKVDAGWVLSINIPDAHNYYLLSKGGGYSVKAMIPMRTYPGIDYTDNRAVPPVDYSLIDRYNSQGSLESNVVHFTLLAPAVPDHIVIEPLSSTILAGGSQSYTATGYDRSNSSLGDMTGVTNFSITNGTCALNVCSSNVPGNQTVTGNYSGKTATASLGVNAANQTIDFRPIPNKTYGDPPFALTATATSGLPVSFIIVSGPATISGNVVTITGVGTVTARASQGGNSNYFPAPSVDQSFRVSYKQGDLNLDGKVDCTDLGIVRASFGKKCGQSKFDSRADLNKDCVVDVRDLATVAQRVPAGTRCP
jgi:hypothetical protein